MEHMEKKGPRISVPQFGGWDQKGGAASEVSSGYTVVFTKARADRQHQKNDLSDVKRQTQLQQQHKHHQDDDDDNNNLILRNNNKTHHQHHHPPPRALAPPHRHHNKKHHDLHGKPEEQASAASSATTNPMGKKRNKIMSWFLCCFRP